MAVATETDAERGGQMRVETGYGTVAGVDWRDRNAGVEIRPENPALRNTVKGWADTTLDEMQSVLQDPGLSARRVMYRIEVRRKNGVDPDIPIADLRNDQKVREVAVLRFVLADDAATNANQGRGANGAHAAAKPAATATAGEVQDQTTPARCAPEPSPTDRGRAPEGTPAVAAPPDPAPPTLPAHEAAVDMVKLAAGFLRASGQRPVDLQWVRWLAPTLLSAADAVQMRLIQDLPEPNRNADSHARARMMVRISLQSWPAPIVAADAGERDAWLTHLVDYAAELLELSGEIAWGRAT